MRQLLVPKILGLLLVTAFLGCAAATNYEEPDGPRYAGNHAPQTLQQTPEQLWVVSFNIKFSEAKKRAIRLLKEDPKLRDADVLLLQEMDAPGVEEIATAMGMNYVYYPAVSHPKTQRDFGNAVLSRWPIVEDQKLILPFRARFDDSQRIATRATLALGQRLLNVYSVHLATPIELGDGSRRAQARAIREDALTRGPSIIGGDFNDKSIAEKVFKEHGFTWPTQSFGKTARFAAVDHLVSSLVPFLDAGMVNNNRAASDHKPIWVNFDVSTLPVQAQNANDQSTAPIP